MAYRQMHLDKSGSGMVSRTACGRSIMRTPCSTGWEEFKKADNQCALCAASKHAVFLARKDAEAWVPEDPDTWKRADDALIARIYATE